MYDQEYLKYSELPAFPFRAFHYKNNMLVGHAHSKLAKLMFKFNFTIYNYISIDFVLQSPLLIIHCG